MSLLVLVAHSGRTLQLDVQPSTRVDAVQHALVSFTGIPVSDQIAMYQGARLDATKFLGAYKLPVDPSATNLEDHPVFLYCRSYLKPGAALPAPEALPPLQVQVPPLAEVNLAHPLHSAASPLVRALPDYERHFQHHLATTRAYWEVAQARLQRCRQLLSEQEVQARAADAARANVEAHYSYILNSYQSFLDKYNTQHAAHELLLSNFPHDLRALEAIELHPTLQQQEPEQQQQSGSGAEGTSLRQDPELGSVPGEACSPKHARRTGHYEQHGPGPVEAVQPQQQKPALRRLADLYPVQRLREWAETCGRSHASFGAKVAELEALFQLLRRDVEGLFMQAPSVDLDALGRALAEHEALLDEHSSMVQVLSKDLRTVRTLVEDVVRQLGSAGASGAGGGGGVNVGTGAGGGMRQGALHDAAAAMEAIHETHRNRVLPRLAQLDGQLAAFAAAVESSKVAMSRDVLGQLQRISGQQSRIRDMKNKLAAFHEVLGRQDAAFAELKAVHRLPSAYRAVLAEAVRRNAWHQLYCGQAGRLAEHMARFRGKEAARRAGFAAQVSRYIPQDLLTRAGLTSEPPQCHVTVPPPAVPLIVVSVADLQRLAYLDERLLASSTTFRASASIATTAAAVSPGSTVGLPLHQDAGSYLHHPHPLSSTQAAYSSRSAAGEGGGGAVGLPQRHPHGEQLSSPHRQQQQQQQRPGATQQGQVVVAPGAPGKPAAVASSSAAFPGTVAVLDADPSQPADPISALEMENARLRAELANHIAAACLRELNPTEGASHATPSAAGPSAAAPAEGPQPAPADAPTQLEPQQAANLPHTQSQSGGPRRSAGGGDGEGPSRNAPTVAGPTQPQATGLPSSASSRRDPAELVAAMHRALSMKDDLIRQQQREAAALAARAAAYEQRIAALEELLAQRSAGLQHSGPRGAEAGGGVGSSGAGCSSSAHTDVQSCGPDGAADGDYPEHPVGGGGGDDPKIPPAEDAGLRGPGARGEGQRPESISATPTADGGDTSAGAVCQEGAEAVSSGAGSSTTRAAAAAADPLAPQDAESQTQQTKAGAHACAASLDASAAVTPSPAVSPVPLSPFSVQAAQQQQQLPAVPQQNPLSEGCASAEAAVEPVKEQGLSTATPGFRVPAAAVRGSSGPQAIPQRGGDLSHSGGVAAEGSPYADRMPMSIGSLPFATSLPVGSALAGRLASSPSGGIGLGLALGFGLTQGPQHHVAHRQQQQHGGGAAAAADVAQDLSGRMDDQGSDTPRGGSLSLRRSSSVSSEDVAELEECDGAEELLGPGSNPAAAAEGADDNGGGSGVSSSSGSSAELQFQPSWSAGPVSGESLDVDDEDGPQNPRAGPATGSSGMKGLNVRGTQDGRQEGGSTGTVGGDGTRGVDPPQVARVGTAAGVGIVAASGSEELPHSGRLGGEGPGGDKGPASRDAEGGEGGGTQGPGPEGLGPEEGLDVHSDDVNADELPDIDEVMD